ncbi:MAG: DUF3352 domain-containing protein, partial [Nocardioides sp.]
GTMTSSMPPTGPQGPEYLEQGGGAPLAREHRSGGGGRRKAIVAGATVVGLAAIGGGVWAATSFFGTGAQPAEALPASTLGYASIDLDPSGGQKIEAIRMLNKFPAFKDEIGLDADDDIKKKIFDMVVTEAPCAGLDYANDIEPWLGDRAAVAAVDTGEEEPVVAVVVQVKDAEAAEEGFGTLQECGDHEGGGWVIDGEWALLAETEALADQVAAETEEATLADDETYQKWTGEVGDAGVLNLYAAPAAGDYLADNMDSLGFPFGPMMGASQPAGPQLPGEMVEGLRDFRGVAATLRFDDGALELESVGDAAAMRQSYFATDAGDDVLASLPSETAVAIGVGLQDGWAQRVLDEVAGMLGSGETPEQMLTQAERWTGLALPEDLETLLGDSTVLAIGNDFDPEAFANSEDGSDIPVAVKVKGDAEAIEGVLDKVRNRIGEPMSDPIRSRSEGDVVAIGPNDAYLAEILGDGGLGQSDAFRNVVREAERAGAIVFVNFDAGGDWLSALAEEDPEAKENLEPLEGLGISSWQDGDTGHGMVRLTTD